MRFLIFFIGLFLYAFNFYVPDNYKGKLPKNFKIIIYHSLKDVNFTNSFVLTDSDNLPFIINNCLKILTPIGIKKEYIISHIDSLSQIKTIANLNLPAKILLNALNSQYREVNATIKDFLTGKIDAIVVNKKPKNEDFYDFDILKYGILFNRYLIVYKGDYNKEFLIKSNLYFESLYDFKRKPVYSSLILISYYLNKKIDFNKVLYENYYLTQEKLEKIKVAVTPNWPPFDIYENGQIKGIGIDFFKLIAKKANLKYEFEIVDNWPKILEMIKNKEVDLTPNTSETKDRKKYALFSKPYYSFPLAIVCNQNSKINSFQNIKELAVGKDFTAEKLMKEHYPYLRFIEVKNTYEALKMTQKNKKICAVDMLPTILWYIQKFHMYNLRLIYKTPFKFRLQIMIRKDRPDLLERINKAIDEISPEEKRNILNRYIGGILKEKTNGFNVLLLFSVLLIIFVLSVFVIKYRKRAMTDELTGILNRRGVIKEAKKIAVDSSALFFDIDHFKKVNDTYGHDFGDYVLKELAKIISDNIRSADVFGRWGGEEFVLILRGTPYEKALKVAEKLRLIVANYDFKGKRVTISIGVAPFRGDLKEAITKADEALYVAKNSGRNQVKGIK
ncbi:transporter substrate-binding domain-containing diguanylate cyclase [Caminibacter sp.]